jgi:hypothetical protein
MNAFGAQALDTVISQPARVSASSIPALRTPAADEDASGQTEAMYSKRLAPDAIFQ